MRILWMRRPSHCGLRAWETGASRCRMTSSQHGQTQLLCATGRDGLKVTEPKWGNGWELLGRHRAVTGGDISQPASRLHCELPPLEGSPWPGGPEPHIPGSALVNAQGLRALGQ